MSGVNAWIVTFLLASPAVVFLGAYFAFRRRAVVAGAVTAVLGAAAGAFLAAAGSAMATSVEPGVAMMRGAAIGFVGSAGVAGVVGIAIRLLRG